MGVQYLVSGKSGTHLPYTNASGSPDHRLMGAAWAALHGGYRGNKYDGPDKDKAITKLKVAYKKEKMDTPQESFAKRGDSLMSLTEAEVMAKMGDSFSSIRCAIGDAIQANINAGIDMDDDDDGPEDVGKYSWVMDVFPTYVAYSMEGNTFMCPWHKDATGQIILGTPFAVDSAYITRDEPYAETEVEQESHRELVRHVSQFTEASYDSSKGELTVKVIQPGFNKSRERFYPAETLRRDFGVFKGSKMFADHQTESETKSRPEGSVHNWVANLGDVWVESDGTIMGKAVVIDPPFKAKLDALNEKGLLSEMGVSIRAVGEATQQTIEGTKTKYVESFLAARSVDFVTYAGAGGQVMAIESSSLADENDVDLMTEAQLRSRRPDLVLIIENKKESTNVKTLEQQLQEAQTENKQLKAKIEATEKDGRKQVAAAELSKLLTESKLPDVAAKRIQKQFAEAENTDGMKEAIDAESEYIKSISPVKKNLGVAENGNTEESEAGKTKPNLVESFKALGLTEEEAKIAAKV
jgi:hypothetical protein